MLEVISLSCVQRRGRLTVELVGCNLQGIVTRGCLHGEGALPSRIWIVVIVRLKITPEVIAIVIGKLDIQSVVIISIHINSDSETRKTCGGIRESLQDVANRSQR